MLTISYIAESEYSSSSLLIHYYIFPNDFRSNSFQFELVDYSQIITDTCST